MYKIFWLYFPKFLDVHGQNTARVKEYRRREIKTRCQITVPKQPNWSEVGGSLELTLVSAKNSADDRKLMAIIFLTRITQSLFSFDLRRTQLKIMAIDHNFWHGSCGACLALPKLWTKCSTQTLAIWRAMIMVYSISRLAFMAQWLSFGRTFT